MKKKIFSIILTAIFTMTSGMTAFAESNSNQFLKSDSLKNAEILMENETLDHTVTMLEQNGQCIVVVDYGDHYEVSRRPVDSFVITLEEYDYNGNLVSSEICDYSYFEKELAHEKENVELEPKAVGEYQHTISNYDYDIAGGAEGRYEIWTCTRKSDEKVRSVHDTTSALFERLDHWRTLVNDINDYEEDLGLTIGKTAAATVIEKYFLKDPAAAFTLLEGIGEAVGIFEDYDATIAYADRVFDRI